MVVWASVGAAVNSTPADKTAAAPALRARDVLVEDMRVPPSMGVSLESARRARPQPRSTAVHFDPLSVLPLARLHSARPLRYVNCPLLRGERWRPARRGLPLRTAHITNALRRVGATAAVQLKCC